MPEARASLEELENREEFVRRHNGPGEADIAAMLGALGLASLDELIERTVPASIVSDTPLAIGESLSGYLVIYDALHAAWRKVRVRRDPECPLCGEAPSITDLSAYQTEAA